MKLKIIKEIFVGCMIHVTLYCIAVFINKFLAHKGMNVITAIDYYIPTLTFPFFMFYISYYVLLFLGPCFVGYKNEKTLNRYTTNLIISTTVGFLIFIFFPTYVDRSCFPIDQNCIFYKPLLLLYKADFNGLALPSFHCLISWLVFIAIRQLRNIYITTKLLFFILCFGICLSTFFIRQHGFIDFPAAVLLAEITNACVTKWKLDILLFNYIENYRKGYNKN